VNFNPNAFEILKERGFIQLTSHEEELKAALRKGPVTFYLGIDPTANNLHIGHCFPLLVFKILQDHGHKGILLLGDATAAVGDPSFKNDMRKMLSKGELEQNANSIEKTLGRFIDIDKTTIVRNGDWHNNMNAIWFMQTVGAHFTAARMLSHECFKSRADLTFFELSYMLLQAYDFVHLNNEYNCTLQIGGTDQWANILAGVDLGRRMAFRDGKQRPLMMAFCNPLLANYEGVKMGKTEKGALWVNPDKTPPYELYQYFLNVSDLDVEKLLTFYSCLPVAEIKQKCKADIIAAKKLMAFEVTKKIHGEVAAKKSQEMAEQLFSGVGTDAPVEKVKAESKVLVDILALTSIIKSKREARELIESGAIQIDGERVTDIGATIDKREFLVKKGKKTFLKVVIV